MQLMHPEPAAALLGLRAMKTIASAAGPIGPAQRGLMEAAKKIILRVDADIDTLPPVTPAELAAGFPGSELRQQFANGMLVMAVADGVPAPETLAKVEAFGAALGITSPVLADLRLLAERHMLLFKLDFLRRGHIADIMKNELHNRGLLGFAKSVLGMRGLMEEGQAAVSFGCSNTKVSQPMNVRLILRNPARSKIHLDRIRVRPAERKPQECRFAMDVLYKVAEPQRIALVEEFRRRYRQRIYRPNTTHDIVVLLELHQAMRDHVGIR